MVNYHQCAYVSTFLPTYRHLVPRCRYRIYTQCLPKMLCANQKRYLVATRTYTVPFFVKNNLSFECTVRYVIEVRTPLSYR